MDTLTLYDYAASANCYKTRLVLAQLGREYRRVAVDIFAGETLTGGFAAMNPARTTPVLEVGEDAYLPESGAILLYLAEGTELLPDEPLARAQVTRCCSTSRPTSSRPSAGCDSACLPGA